MSLVNNMIINRLIRKFLNVFGYEIVRLKSLNTGLSLGNWVNKLNISTIIDVGSNEGQFIQSINQLLPNKKIIAFEPIKSVYEALLKNTQGIDVTAYNCALSDAEGTSEINISKNSVSSSLLNMEDLHKSTYPQSAYITKETIQLKRLDDVVPLNDKTGNILLKIDVQGYENMVIAGGPNVIKAASIVIIEFSFQPLYEGQWLFHETYNYFTSNGYRFVGFADQVADPNIRVPLYGDAMFVKEQLLNKIYH
ncbi:MAG: hypothetical protein JWQ38_853 [Flavipsychrobacter sp.]|nr:hypothetical protein [Flavipsychrobacter sp.]